MDRLALFVLKKLHLKFDEICWSWHYFMTFQQWSTKRIKFIEFLSMIFCAQNVVMPQSINR